MLKETNQPNLLTTEKTVVAKIASYCSNYREKVIIFWQSNRIPLTIWAVWRLAAFVLPVFAVLLFPYATNVPPARADTVWQVVLFDSWGHWDGNFYKHIGSFGYTEARFLAFFPLYPYFMSLVALVISFGTISSQTINLAGIIISSVAGLVACGLLYRLARLEYGNEIAYYSTFYLMAYPMAFFLFAVYSEALFLALTIGAFYAARRQRWLIAMLLTVGAVLTRNLGILLLLALLIEYGQQRRERLLKLGWPLMYFLLPVVAFSGWLAYNALAFGDPLRFLQISQIYWRRVFVPPWNTWLTGGAQFLQLADVAPSLTPNSLSQDLNVFEFPLTSAFVILAVVAIWAVWKSRLRLSYFVFFALGLLQPLSAPNQDYVLMSMPRYFLILFPAFFLLALAGRRWRFLHYAYLAVSLPLLVLFTARFVLWYWVA